MAWLFACFGYSKKRKRLKPARSTVHSNKKAQVIGSYTLLQESLASNAAGASIEHSNPRRSNLKIRRRSCDNQGKSSIRKKVRFDLKVIKYEPLHAYYNDDDDKNEFSFCGRTLEEEKDDEYEEEEQVEEDTADFLQCSTGSKRVRLYQGSYRYSNSYNDDDEEEDEISDIEDKDGEDGIGDGTLFIHQDIYHEEVCVSHQEHPAAGETDYASITSNLSQSQHSKNLVLVPIVNLQQLKAIKAKQFEMVA